MSRSWRRAWGSGDDPRLVMHLLGAEFVVRTFLVMVPLFAASCFGQRLEVGAKLGVPLTPAFKTSSSFTIDFGEGASSATRRYTVGPMVGLRLAHGFGVEFDALYKRLGFDDDLKSAGVVFTHTRVTANSWEFPTVGKFRFLDRSVPSPYVEAGVSFRHVSGVSVSSVTSFPGQVTSSTGTTSAVLNNRSNRGAVVGVGAEVRISFLRISPEIRYTRWGVDRNLDPQLHTNQNQIEALLGIVF